MNPRKFTASLLQACWDFSRAHRAVSFLAALVLGAACAGALYLLAVQFPTVIDLSCLTGGCGK